MTAETTARPAPGPLPSPARTLAVSSSAGVLLGVLVIHTTASFAMFPDAAYDPLGTLRLAFSMGSLPLLAYHALMGAVVGASAGVLATRAYRRELAEREKAKALEARLERSQRMEGIGRLAAGVAHDFNNVLTALRMSLFLAKGAAAKGKDATRYLEEAERSVERGAQLPRQLLAFAARQPAEPKVADAAALVHDLEKMLRRLLGDDVELQTELAPANILIDVGQFEQVLVNLAVNARDAMPEGGLLRISTRVERLSEAAARERELPAGDYVVTRVADTGTGMSPETLARIFEPFFTTKPEGKGTGLGLATVYGIVTQSRGSIRVESSPGRGTTFDVYLPLAAGAASATGSREEPAPSAEPSVRLLVVDDQDPVRIGVASVLRSLGYSVTEASSATEALARLQEMRREAGRVVLLTDVVMPGMRGPELATLARAVLPDVRVVFMSGFSEGELPPEWASEPLLTKPFTPSSLGEAIGAVARR